MREWRLGEGGFEFNRDPEVQSQFDMAPDVYLVDSTIRSLQSTVSGSRHTPDDLVAIGLALDEIGVRELIVNAVWRDGIETVKGLARARPKAMIVGAVKARNPRLRELVTTLVDAGVDEILFESATDRHSLEDIAGLAQSNAKRFHHGFTDLYTWNEIVELSRAGRDLGYSSLRYDDSYFGFGITPEAMRLFIRRLRTEIPGHPPLYVHLSNFYGQATMTVVAAITAGATAADVCLNVTGHHCGHTSLAEVSVILSDLYGIDTGIRLGGIAAAADVVTRRTGVPIRLQQPVIGKFAFMGDGAFWANEAHRPPDDRIYARFPFEPELVGSSEQLVWSDKTATAETVGLQLAAFGLDATPEAATRVLDALATRLASKGEYPNWLTSEEFRGLALEVGQ